ncbi:TTC38-like protein [Mya arenaria]|uniref:Tetratricopeptide repeat protein 38 n=1 Tax=Mya arenaria TaxID=6604 RepID=A0ABY7EFL7_MYAAR|nr:TTC38-like protein [Mya arenaria]
MHSNWRDCKAWLDNGLPINTTCNEAAKLYDASLTQYVGKYNDMNVGGLEKSMEDTLRADPNFVMGHVIKNGLNLLGTGTSIQFDNKLATDVDTMVRLCFNQQGLSDREKMHVNAVKLWSVGKMARACDIWEDILLDNPSDILALKYLYGMYAFGLEETNLYPEAEKFARMGLEINEKDVWSTHCIAHVMEMTGRHDEGIKFMSGTENNWAVYKTSKSTGAPLHFVDACSLLLRLNMEGVRLEGRWNDCYEVIRPHVDDHVLTFNDNHILLACLGANKIETVKRMMTSIKESVVKCTGDLANITKEVGLPICEAFVAYNDGDYAKAVDLMYPIRYQVWKIGGSNAQRDIYNIFLINAALKSNKQKHRRLASRKQGHRGNV